MISKTKGSYNDQTQIAGLNIIHGDCMEVMGQYSGSDASERIFSFDLALSDPDYGLSHKLTGGQWAARWKCDATEYGGVPDRRYFDLLMKVSRDQVIWGGNYFLDHLRPSRCFLVWDKKNKTHTMADCEMAWTSFDRNARTFFSARNPGGITGHKRIHLCQKPVQLYIWILLNFSYPGCRVIDTHMGSGSSAIAVYEVNKWLISLGEKPIEYIGVEISQRYYSDAVQRIRNHVKTHPECEVASELLQMVSKPLGMEMVKSIGRKK